MVDQTVDADGSESGRGAVPPAPTKVWIVGARGVRTEGKSPWNMYSYVASGYGRSENEAIGSALRALIDNGATDGLAYHCQPINWEALRLFGDGAGHGTASTTGLNEDRKLTP